MGKKFYWVWLGPSSSSYRISLFPWTEREIKNFLYPIARFEPVAAFEHHNEAVHYVGELNAIVRERGETC